jgi:hypothetical protein
MKAGIRASDRQTLIAHLHQPGATPTSFWVTTPCGERVCFGTMADVPSHSAPCPCGAADCWAILYESEVRIGFLGAVPSPICQPASECFVTLLLGAYRQAVLDLRTSGKVLAIIDAPLCDSRNQWRSHVTLDGRAVALVWDGSAWGIEP